MDTILQKGILKTYQPSKVRKYCEVCESNFGEAALTYSLPPKIEEKAE